jgi:hypothetical protein
MSQKIPDRIEHFVVDSDVLQLTLSRLRQIGLENKEAIAYWTGKIQEGTAMISNVIFPGEYHESFDSTFHASVPLSTAYKVGEMIHERGEKLIAQVHTHPYEAFHSYVDDAYPISHRVGFISIVVPYFARRAKSLGDFKFYEYLGNGKWEEWDDEQISSRFMLGDNSNE